MCVATTAWANLKSIHFNAARQIAAELHLINGLDTKSAGISDRFGDESNPGKGAMASLQPVAAACASAQGAARRPSSLRLSARSAARVGGFSTSAKVHYLVAFWWFLDSGATESSLGT